ncbi:MAG TPA: hypothetical protein VK507_10365, partial [Iamia sp.]|nr:hypothetical protein [Iamia sp.]
TPLGSLRVLLSPGPEDDLADLPPRIDRATLANVTTDLIAFREDCQGPRAGRAIVYVAGHGVEVTKGDVILLLEDFASRAHPGPLTAALDMDALNKAFSAEGFAPQQLWLTDACRVKAAAVDENAEVPRPVLGFVVPHGSVASSPHIVASAPEQSAFGTTGERTFFGDELLNALAGAGAVGPDDANDPGGLSDQWHVTTHSLSRYLETWVPLRATGVGEVQRVDPIGTGGIGLVSVLRTPPEVPVTIDAIPVNAAKASTVALLDDHLVATKTSPEIPVTWPDVPAGLYTIQVASAAPYPATTNQSVDVKPMSCERTLEIGTA